MEEEAEQTHEVPYKEEPSVIGGFLRRHKGRIISYTVLPTLLYGLLTFMVGIINHNTPARYEEFNPRRHEKIEKETPMLFKAIGYLAENFGDELVAIVNAPWRAMNVVTCERYSEVRKQAFEIAGIDEKNPEHDAKRFAFYRQLGIAVRETEDHTQSAYIPFEKLKEYVEKNSSTRVNEKWKESISEETYKGKLMLQGKAYFKADADEKGTVGDKEWEQAIHKMGYRSQEEVLENLTGKMYGKTKDELKTELEKIIKESKENPDCLKGNIPKEIPISKLKEYISE